jgi:hypothetical protein
MLSCLLLAIAFQDPAQEKPVPVPFTVIERGDISYCKEAQRAVYVDAAQWEHAWRMHKGRLSQAPLPQVDFKTEIVLFVSKGDQPTTGYELEIKRIEQTSAETQVYFRKIDPGRQAVGAMVTHPYTIVRIERSDRKVKFVEEK